MEQLRVGVIGVGQMGRKHAEVYARLPHTDLAALADPRVDACRSAANALGAERVFADYRELLAEKDIDAVSICTPDELHREPVLAALEAGKHVLLEKPLSTDIREAEEIAAVAERSSRKLMIAYLLRYDPRYLAVKDAIERGDLGDLVYIVSHRNSPHTEGPARYKDGTSLTMHVAVHDLDLIAWFADSPPRTAQAVCADKVLRPKRMLDAVSALITFEDGAFASVNYGWVLPERSTTRLDARMEIVGTKGSAYVGVYHEQAILLATENGIHAPDVHHAPVLGGDVRGDLREEIMAFVDCVVRDEPSPVPAAEALRSLRMASAIEQSIRSGQAPVCIAAPRRG